MSFSQRSLKPGLWHHATNRAPEGRALFRTDADVAAFVGWLGTLPAGLGLEIHAYCVMGSHYHLLVRATTNDLADAVDWLDVRIARRAFEIHGATGPVFRGRFDTRPVRAGRHLLRAARYIHLNPVEAGLVERPGDWPYSSYRAYLDPRHEPGWLRTSVILGWFGSIGARELHRRFVEDSSPPSRHPGNFLLASPAPCYTVAGRPMPDLVARVPTIRVPGSRHGDCAYPVPGAGFPAMRRCAPMSWMKQKNDSDPVQPRPSVDSRPSSAPVVRDPAPPPVTRDRASIGPSMKIKGELEGSEDLTIEGRVEGKIVLNGCVLTIGTNGMVEASIGDAGSVIVQGEMRGNITAVDKVEVGPTGSMLGDIRAPRVVLADGARFKGDIDMEPVAVESKPAKASEKADVKPSAKPATASKTA